MNKIKTVGISAKGFVTDDNGSVVDTIKTKNVVQVKQTRVHFLKEWFEDRYDDVFYGLKLYKVEDFFREIKWAWQRGTRGYADCDTWNIDWTLAILIPKMLRHLAKNNNGCPNEFFDKENKDNQCHLWTKKLEEISCGFDDFIKAQDLTIETTYEDFKVEYDKLMDNFYKQMDEFKKYYGHFWD